MERESGAGSGAESREELGRLHAGGNGVVGDCAIQTSGQSLGYAGVGKGWPLWLSSTLAGLVVAMGLWGMWWLWMPPRKQLVIFPFGQYGAMSYMLVTRELDTEIFAPLRKPDRWAVDISWMRLGLTVAATTAIVACCWWVVGWFLRREDRRA